MLNMTDAPINLKTERSRTQDIPAKRHAEHIQVRPGQTLKVRQGDKVIEEYKVGEAPLDFDPESDGRMLFIAGGPAQLVVADYTDFYTPEGETPVVEPKIKLVANLRGKKSVLLNRGDQLSWPEQKIAQTKRDGGGFKNVRFLRVVPITDDLKEEQLMEYLNYEFAAKSKEDVPAPAVTPK